MIYTYELQPKFRLMESRIRDIFIFWKLSLGLENDNTLFEKTITFAYIPKPEKTIIHSSKIDDLELYTVPHIDRGPYDISHKYITLYMIVNIRIV